MWTCLKCGKIENDDSKEFCFECMTVREIPNEPNKPIASLSHSTSEDSKLPSSTNKILSIIFLCLSLLVGLSGASSSFRDSKVVGGDAYNYIIGAGRGTAVVGLAIIFAVTSLIFAVFDMTNKMIYYNKIRK